MHSSVFVTRVSNQQSTKSVTSQQQAKSRYILHQIAWSHILPPRAVSRQEYICTSVTSIQVGVKQGNSA